MIGDHQGLAIPDSRVCEFRVPPNLTKGRVEWSADLRRVAIFFDHRDSIGIPICDGSHEALRAQRDALAAALQEIIEEAESMGLSGIPSIAHAALAAFDKPKVQPWHKKAT